jgi:mRNA interferase MazF
MKDFDNWNNLKKKLENKVSNKLFREGEIWWCSFGENLGKEVCGKNIYFERPALILRKFDNDTALALPITSTIKEGSFYCNLFLNGKERNVLLHQARFISSKRLLRKIEKISSKKLSFVEESFSKLYKIEKRDFSRFSQVPNGKDSLNISNSQNKSNEDLLKFSSKTKKDADEILKNLDLLNILSRFGEVRIGGSYYLDLMWGPDIDINVKSENHRSSALNFLDEILQKRLFQKVEFGDFEKFERERRPKAFIVVCKIEFNNRKWEIEIWFKQDFDTEYIDKIENKIKNLSSDKRLEILKIKEKRELSKLDKHKLSSLEIYRNILEK